MNTTELPLISIITICYNSAKTIRRTIQSVKQQQVKSLEYIFIDGGSTDETIEVINAENPGNFIVESGKDRGISSWSPLIYKCEPRANRVREKILSRWF